MFLQYIFFFFNEDIANLLEFGSKTHERLKERFFFFLLGLDKTGQNVQIFEEVLFFKLRTTLKQTINSIYLVSVGCGRQPEGKGHEID